MTQTVDYQYGDGGFTLSGSKGDPTTPLGQLQVLSKVNIPRQSRGL